VTRTKDEIAAHAVRLRGGSITEVRARRVVDDDEGMLM
jgi:hypothetical protein